MRVGTISVAPPTVLSKERRLQTPWPHSISPPCSHSSQRPLVVVAADVRDALRGRDCNGCLRTSAIPIQPTVSDCPCSFLSYLLPYACLCTSRLSTIGIAILYLSTSTSVPRTKLLRPVPTSRGPTQKHSEDQLSCAETSNRPSTLFRQ